MLANRILPQWPGLAVGLAHVVGHLDEGQGAQGHDQQGGDGGDFGAGHAQGAGQEGGGMRSHGPLTVKLKLRSRLRDITRL